MKVLKELKEILLEEMERIVDKGEISTSDVDIAYKMIDIVKDIDTIHAMEDYGDDYPRRRRRRGVDE